MTREANRARFPEFAAIVDSCGGHAKLLFAEDANGTLGKRPEPEFEMDGAAYVRALESAKYFGHRPVKVTK